MSFGKKGLAAGQAQRPVRSASPFQQPANRIGETTEQSADPMSAKRDAFIAAERARSSPGSAKQDAAEYTGSVPSYSGRGEAFAKPSFFDQFAPRKPSMVAAYLIWFFLCNISAHRFYLGAHKSALKQIGLLFGSLILGFLIHPVLFIGFAFWALWVLGDIFLIPGLHRRRMQESGYDTRVFA